MARPSPTVLEPTRRSGQVPLGLAEEALLAAEDDRVEHRPQLVEAVLDQGPHAHVAPSGPSDGPAAASSPNMRRIVASKRAGGATILTLGTQVASRPTR